MQTEVAKVLQETKDISANANFGYHNKVGLTIGAGANYATHSSKEENTKQAITEAKEVTAKALDRKLTKVK